jgi:hypothetical protein
MSNEVTISSIEALLDETIEKKIEPIIKSRFEKQEAKRFRQMSMVIALLSFIGIGAIGGWVTSHINNEVERRVDLASAETLDTLDLSAFISVVSDIDRGDSFTPEQEQTVVNYLTDFKDKPHIRSKPDFILSLQKVVGNFVSADRTRSLEKIFSMYRDESIKDPKILTDLAHNYGQALLARPFTPRNDNILDSFEYLESYAQSVKFPEIPLLYRIVHEAKKSPDSKKAEVTKLLVYSSSLEDLDLDNMLTYLLVYTNAENWMKNVTPEGIRIQESVRQTLRVYKDDLVRIYKIDNPRVIDAAIAGALDRQTASSLATAIVTIDTDQFTY